MSSKIDNLFENIYSETSSFIDLNFEGGSRNVGRVNEAKKIELNKESVKDALGSILSKKSINNTNNLNIITHVFNSWN